MRCVSFVFTLLLLKTSFATDLAPLTPPTTEEIKELEEFSKTLDDPKMKEPLDHLLNMVKDPKFIEASQRAFKELELLKAQSENL